jgi:hypothetical protein
VAKSTVTPANSAVAQLQDQIETIRQEAYQEGYQAAMRAVIDFTAGTARPKPNPKTTAPLADALVTPSAAPRQARQARPAAGGTNARVREPAARRTTSRGDNARHISDALSALPERTGPAAAIRKALAAKGIDMPYTSIRHALGQLQARGEATVAEDGRTWSYTAPQHQ